MDIALVNGHRTLPTPKARGTCQWCGHNMIAKCGPRLTHHWAHARRAACDPWWENETDWHRAWKARFPEDSREVLRFADNGEKHIADVKLPSGIVLEFQHSFMTDEERLSRERFYKNLIWIVDAAGFSRHFHFMNRLPLRNSDIARDMVWEQRLHHWSNPESGHFWLRSENPEIAPTGAVHGQAIMIKGETHWAARHHPDLVLGLQRQFHWVKPRATWLESTVPVYLDFGGEILWRLEKYDDSGLRCVSPHSIDAFMAQVMTTTDPTSRSPQSSE